EVVAGKDERLLDGACCDDDARRADAKQERAGLDGHEPAFVDPDRPAGGDELEPLWLEARWTLVDEQDALAAGCRFARRLDTGSAQTRTFGVPSTVIMQFGHAPEQQRRPRGR